MESEQPPTQSESRLAFGFVLLFCFSVLLVVIFLSVLDMDSSAFSSSHDAISRRRDDSGPTQISGVAECFESRLVSAEDGGVL
jgi:hypothetical protein